MQICKCNILDVTFISFFIVTYQMQHVLKSSALALKQIAQENPLVAVKWPWMLGRVKFDRKSISADLLTPGGSNENELKITASSNLLHFTYIIDK